MEIEDKDSLVRDFMTSIVEGNGKEAVKILKVMSKMDINIEITVEDRIEDNQMYNHLLQELLNLGFDEVRSKLAAKNSATLDDAINYIYSN